MRTELTVKQRLDLQSILPQQGDFLTAKMIRVLREELGFSEEEHKLLKFKHHPNGSVEWDANVADQCWKEIEIPETIVTIIKEILEKANTNKQIMDAHVDFYELFMGT